MILNPIVEYASISKWVAGLINKSITPHNFVRQLGKHLNKHHSIKVDYYRGDDSILSPGDFTIGAEYDPSLDEERRKQFKLTLIINQPKKSPWLITGKIADDITLELVEALVHEYRHQHQYRSRRFMMNRGYVNKHSNNTTNDQEYLGMPDEIDAYAANIAARFYILKYKLNTIEPIVSLDLDHYRRTFGNNHLVMRKLLKKIAQNISYLKAHDNGKIRKRSKCRVRRRPR
jgi:hypothetical protein